MTDALLHSISSSKLKKYESSVFANVASMSVQYNAVNMAQGFPNFNFSPRILEFANEYINSGYNQYAPAHGDLQLREQISEKMNTKFNANYHPEKEITITTGALQAVYTALTSIIEKNDEVIVFEPAFDSYCPVIELNGGVPVRIELTAPHYSIDWEEVKQKINRNTRAIIINSPNNPTGKIFTSEDFESLIALVRETNIIVISDEVYENMVFDGQKHISAALYPELKERAFVISSFGKSLHVTGWRVGYCLAPDYLMGVFRKIHQFMVFSASSHAFQKAIAKFIKEEKNYEQEVAEIYRKKRDHFSTGIKFSRFKQLPTEATFFMLLDYAEISKEKSTEFSKKLIIDHKIATIPMSAFYNKPNASKIIRICFAKTDDVLDKAVMILNTV